MLNTKRLSLLLCFLCVFAVPAVKAEMGWADTIVYSLQQKPRFFLNASTFNSYISGDFANFIGIRTGLSYNKRVRFGAAYFRMNGSTVISPVQISDGEQEYTTNGQLRFGYVALSSDYTFYNDYPWQFSVMPVQFGFGKARHEYIRRPDHLKVSTPSSMVIFWQPEVTAQYNVFQWFGVSLSTGYRKTIYVPREISENFNSPTFAIGIRVFVDELMKEFKSVGKE